MFEASGVVLTTDPQRISDDQDVRAGAVEGWVGGFTARARMGTADVDVRLGFVQRPKIAFSLGLCSPRIEDDALVALRAQRAFEIVRAGLQSSDP